MLLFYSDIRKEGLDFFMNIVVVVVVEYKGLIVFVNVVVVVVVLLVPQYKGLIYVNVVVIVVVLRYNKEVSLAACLLRVGLL
jgi:hypothetical protein